MPCFRFISALSLACVLAACSQTPARNAHQDCQAAVRQASNPAFRPISSDDIRTQAPADPTPAPKESTTYQDCMKTAP